ncbi:hypothetical protein B5P46_25140 [Rhizobium leguminosarum]|uniref:Uncharacterized protein n=1 Tax=Rhizobium leguminosarum TaxID=384 RepID=A0A4V1P081_RHILE|nr:hypothetical protein B5P46_25140 [Rhizobium leguminosarum]
MLSGRIGSLSFLKKIKHDYMHKMHFSSHIWREAVNGERYYFKTKISGRIQLLRIKSILPKTYLLSAYKSLRFFVIPDFLRVVIMSNLWNF